MSEPIVRRGHPICISLDDEALHLLRLMTDGPKTMGRLISMLIHAEVARREARYAERQQFEAALAMDE